MNDEFNDDTFDEDITEESFDEDSFDDDSFDESAGNSSNGMNPAIKWTIVGVVSVVVFFAVYFVTDALINGGNKNTPIITEDTPMTLNDEMITYLYGNVSYDVFGARNEIFFKNAKVEYKDFSNNDKFFFAMRYLTSADFTAIYEEVEVNSGSTTTTTTETTTTDSEGNTSTDVDTEVTGDSDKTTVMKVKEYSVSNDVIGAAMEDFFGEEVSYSYDAEIPIGVNFKVNGNNAGNLRYDSASDSFLIKFDRKTDALIEDSPIKPYYGQIVSAIKLAENYNIVIKEKVIFTQYTVTGEDNNAVYNYKVCADYQCNEVLETKNGVTKDQYYNNPIELDDYEDKATTITYTFYKDSNNEYHFVSSEKDK